MSVLSVSRKRVLVISGLICSLATSVIASEKLYFHNKRTLEVSAYEIKGALIRLTLPSGRRVYMRADSVDWVGTETLRNPDYELRAMDYAAVDPKPGSSGEGEFPLFGGGRPLTATDLKKGLSARAKRRSVPTWPIDVEAATAWKDTGIKINRGGRVTIRATGDVDLGDNVSVGPSGRASRENLGLVTNLPHGALLMRIGLAGTPTMVGAQRDFIAPADGTLYMAVNDGTPNDNSGSFTVIVKLPPAASSGRPVAGVSTASGYSGDDEAPPQATGSSPRRSGRPATGVGAIDRARNVRDTARQR